MARNCLNINRASCPSSANVGAHYHLYQNVRIIVTYVRTLVSAKLPQNRFALLIISLPVNQRVINYCERRYILG